MLKSEFMSIGLSPCASHRRAALVKSPKHDSGLNLSLSPGLKFPVMNMLEYQI